MCTFIPSYLHEIKIVEDAEKLNHSYIMGKNVKTMLENIFCSFKKNKHTITTRPSNSTFYKTTGAHSSFTTAPTCKLLNWGTSTPWTRAARENPHYYPEDYTEGQKQSLRLHAVCFHLSDFLGLTKL